MKLLLIFLLSIFITMWKYALLDGETLNYRLLLNDDPANVEVKIIENETITIFVHYAEENFGETLLDFRSGFIAIKGHEKNCYIFPIPPSSKFLQTKRFLQSIKDKEEQTFCTANVSASIPYRIKDITEYGSSIAAWCADKVNWGIFSIISESPGVEVSIQSQAEFSPFCIFVGFIYIFGRGQMVCFRSVQTLKDMYAYKMDFEDHKVDIFLAAVCHPREIPSRQRGLHNYVLFHGDRKRPPSKIFTTQMSQSQTNGPMINNKIGYWITSQPGILFSEDATDPLAMLYEYHGFSLYEIGLEGLMNLNINQCLLVPIPQKSSLLNDLKMINEKSKNGTKTENILCNYRNGQQFYNMVNEIYRIQEFCSYENVISIKNCRLIGNHFAKNRPCLFKGFLHTYENRYQAVCIQAIE